MTATFNLRYLAQLSAISRLSDYESSVRELVMQVVAVADSMSLKTTKDIQVAADAYFGIPLELKTVDSALDLLVAEDRIRVELGSLTLSGKEQKNRTDLVAASQELEIAVYDNWQTEIKSDGTIADIDFGDLRKCMAVYLTRAFRQHGIETAQMLDAASELGKVETESLVHVLNSTISQHFPKERASAARNLVTNFFRNSDKYPERKKHLIELADGTFSFFTFFIDPAVSARLREGLTKIEFFLDTNYLWGLLGLHDNQYVESSVEFFSLAKRLNLPFSFRYHKETERELFRSVASASDSLRQKVWKASISDTLKKSAFISGIERKFHEKNAVSKTDVSMFLKPFENISRMVQEQDIRMDNREVQWGAAVNDLFHEYDEYLQTIEKGKSYEAMEHDMRLLWLARSMRSNSKSPLHAGTLLLTCDSRLYNFDVHNSRKHGRWPTAILPNVLLQILRPAIKQTDDFDTMFVKTFSLPEFRSYSKKSSQAVQTMAEILTAVDGWKPAMIEQLLMDEILVKEIAHAKSSHEIVDKLNAAIVERVAVFETELSQIKAELANEKSHNSELELADREHQHRIKEFKEVSSQLAEGSDARVKIEATLDKEKQGRLIAEAEAARLRADNQRQQDLIQTLKSAGGILLCCASAFLISWAAHYCDLVTKPSKLAFLFLTVLFSCLGLMFKARKEWCVPMFSAAVASVIALLA